MVSNRGFGPKQKQAGQQEIPPETLLPLGVLGRYFGGRLRLAGGKLAGASGPRSPQLVGIERREVRFGRVDVDRNSVSALGCARSASNFIKAVLVELQQARFAGGHRDAS